MVVGNNVHHGLYNDLEPGHGELGQGGLGQRNRAYEGPAPRELIWVVQGRRGRGGLGVSMSAR